MKQTRYLLVAVILTIVLGLFLVMGTITSRRVMLDMIKDEARSILSLVSLVQQNSILAEAKLEDEIIDKFINVASYLEETGISQKKLNDINMSFDISSIAVFNQSSGALILRTGHPYNISDTVFKDVKNIYYEYFLMHKDKYIRLIYKLGGHIYQFELSAEKIRLFSEESGINKMLNQVSSNPLIKYLALQDLKGIIFATSNVKMLSRLEGDTLLMEVLKDKKEITRIVMFEQKDILELAQPFTIGDKAAGIFRIGISLESYNQHSKKTFVELIAVFITLFVIGFILFYIYSAYQSYLGLEDLFSRTLSSIEEGVMMIDARGKITGVNSQFCALSDHEEKTILHATYDDIFKGDPFSVSYVLQNRTRIEEEKELFNRFVQYASYPMINKKGVVSSVIIVLRDVTRVRRFEKEQKESERLSFLGNLVANFAHEIKNPLNGLSIAAQRLTREFPVENDDYKHLTNTLLKEINSLNLVLNDFLSLVRPHIKEKEVFDLGRVVKDTLSIIKEQLNTKGYGLTEEIANDLKMSGHPDDLKRAILNILVNSVDAISTRQEGRGEITIKLLVERDVFLIIEDNGPGIEKDEQDKIFTPYFTTKKGGTGLGLYIAQKIISDHEGRITVESSKGIGTKFTIVFPLHLFLLDTY